MGLKDFAFSFEYLHHELRRHHSPDRQPQLSYRTQKVSQHHQLTLESENIIQPIAITAQFLEVLHSHHSLWTWNHLHRLPLRCDLLAQWGWSLFLALEVLCISNNVCFTFSLVGITCLLLRFTLQIWILRHECDSEPNIITFSVCIFERNRARILAELSWLTSQSTCAWLACYSSPRCQRHPFSSTALQTTIAFLWACTRMSRFRCKSVWCPFRHRTLWLLWSDGNLSCPKPEYSIHVLSGRTSW